MIYKTYEMQGYAGARPVFSVYIKLHHNFAALAASPDGLLRRVAMDAVRRKLWHERIPRVFVYAFSDEESLDRCGMAANPNELVFYATGAGCVNCLDSADKKVVEGCDAKQPHGNFMVSLRPIE